MPHDEPRISPSIAIEELNELRDKGSELLDDDELTYGECESWHNRVLDILLHSLGEVHGVHVFSDFLEHYHPEERNERREKAAALERGLVLGKALEQLGNCIITLASIADSQAEQAAAQVRGSDALETVELICRNFHRVAMQLRRRHNDRHTLVIQDEYDVQDLIHALLKLHFEDVREEESSPSHAGGGSRMDFLLSAENMVVEIKKTRSGLGDRQLGEELIVDQRRYARHPHCRTLVCFVYDPDNILRNPEGLRRDLEGRSEELVTRVFIYSR